MIIKIIIIPEIISRNCIFPGKKGSLFFQKNNNAARKKRLQCNDKQKDRSVKIFKSSVFYSQQLLLLINITKSALMHFSVFGNRDFLTNVLKCCWFFVGASLEVSVM